MNAKLPNCLSVKGMFGALSLGPLMIWACPANPAEMINPLADGIGWRIEQPANYRTRLQRE
jgi:hypothetical protein